MRLAKILLSITLFALISWNQQGLAANLPPVTGNIWFNSKPLLQNDIENRVVLVFFWTFGCHNCRAVEPYIEQWYQRYAKDGLTVIAIHSPEFDYERNADNVKEYIVKNRLTYPIVLDNDFVNWKRFSNHYWPTIYLADRKGNLVYQKIGEGSYQQTERWIQNLVNESPF